MRWSIIRLIWLREMRDQLRDRRTLFMIVVLPLLLYPVLGYAVLQFAASLQGKPSVIGLVRGPAQSDSFPERFPPGAGQNAAFVAAWFSVAPNLVACPQGIIGSGMALADADRRLLDYPLLVQNGRRAAAESSGLKLLFLERKDDPQARAVDLVLSASADFYAAMDRSASSFVDITWSRDDDRTRQALNRLQPWLESWKNELKKVRLARQGLPSDFDQPFTIRLPEAASASGRLERMFDMLVRIFPFMLVMWSLAGALYPAVDLCAGEKERGTMETLLISPAAREEIVLGKFLTIWLFSAATALMNLVSMGVTTWQLRSLFLHSSLTMGALSWCVVLVIPQSAFFSAISLAIGAYARSSKEGQYYLMPLFIITMPLIFLTLAPGVELSPFYSLVPVTGVALLMQRLMTASTLGEVPWPYFMPVLAPIALYSWLALRWAVFQFQREEVLFREAERLDIQLWLRRLFRDKEATPTLGQAIFCFVTIMGLRWLSLGLGTEVPALVHTGVTLLAFVATPALVMAVLLNTRPREGLALRWPQLREIAVAALLALLLLPPLAALTVEVFSYYPRLKDLLEDRQPLVQELRALGIVPGADLPPMLWYLLVFGLLASVCEELAFRGFILAGLKHSMRPRNAILLSSFLFALFHMNVFQFLPAFFLGVVLGLLTVRSKSLLPAVIFHLLHNSMLVVSLYIVRTGVADWLKSLWPIVIVVCAALALTLLWRLYRRPFQG